MLLFHSLIINLLLKILKNLDPNEIFYHRKTAGFAAIPHMPGKFGFQSGLLPYLHLFSYNDIEMCLRASYNFCQHVSFKQPSLGLHKLLNIFWI